MIGGPLGCAVPFVLIFTFVGGAMAFASLRPSSWMFDEVFEDAPGDEISDLRGSTAAGFDSRTIFLAFQASPQSRLAVQRMTQNARRRPADDLLGSIVFSGDAPDWWRADAQSCRHRRWAGYQDFGYWQSLDIVDCAADGRIYVLASRID